jgi:hypothetical protein
VLQYDEESLASLGREWGLEKIWLEIDEAGSVEREIGFAADGTIRHKYPGDGPFGRYGVFDLACFTPGTEGDVPVERFEQMWAQPRTASEAEFEEKPGVFGKLFSLLSTR